MTVELPSGTVTFLFTDIEDSTRRWEQEPAAMSAALARHDDLLVQAVSVNRGVVFAKSGDGMAVVFGRAGDAIAAAAAAQWAFEIEPWPTALRVRMGVHTGEAEERGGDYFGPAVNRAARLMSEATGGQVFVSLSTAEVVRDRLPAGVTLVELGERTLRSLTRPERVFELVWSADYEPLPQAAPPPPVGTQTRSGLIGRDAELADIIDMVGSERLVTLVGPGGVGKTTLAMEAARRDRTGRETAVAILTSVTDPTALADVLASVLGLRGNIGDPLQAALALLRSRPWLVVVDNCEHLLPAVRELVATLSNSCDELTILATSRERLGLPLEQVCRVAPLPLPASDQLDDLASVPSVALFMERARRVRPGFGTDDGQAAAVATVVRRLDGMPLAIELAAGRLSSLSLADLDRRLDRALDVLTAGAHVDQHHGTLRAAIEWSYNLLPDDEQRLFRVLAVFPDGFDLATAEDVAHEVTPTVDPTTAVAHLVDASMLVATFADAARYRMLDTLRVYGLDRLAATNELDSATERLLRWAVRLTGWIERAVMTEDEPSAAARLVAEVGNLRAVWHTARSTGNLDVAAALVVSLWWPLRWRDLGELWNWALELAADPRLLDHPSAVCVMAAAAEVTIRRGQLEDAEMFARHGLELAGDGDAEGRWRCGMQLASLDLFQGRLAEGIARYVSLAVPGWEAVTFDLAAICAAYAGDLDEARRFNERARATGSSPSIRALNHYVTAEIDNLAGGWASAQQHYRDSIALAGTAGTAHTHGIASVGLVAVQAASGQVGEALAGYRDLIDHWERIGAWTQQWTTLRNAADLFDQLGDHHLGSFLRDAADRAPEASVAGATTGRPQAGDADSRPTMARDIDAYRPEEVLDITRKAIDRWLTATATN